MTADGLSLRAEGERVWVASATENDIAAYTRAVEQSRDRLARWNPVDPHGLPGHLALQSASHQSLLIHAREAAGAHDLVGKVTVSSVVRGRLLSGSLGYDAFDPYAGRGLFREGLRLAIDLAFASRPGGLGLHRVEASVRPGNVRSAGLLRGLGFVREGFSPRFLILPDQHGQERWRDHDRYAVLSSEWPAAPYRLRPPARTAVLVNGVPGSGKTTLATALAAELGLPLFSKDTVKEAVADALPPELLAERGSTTTSRDVSAAIGAGASMALWALLAESPRGGVVESWFWPDESHAVVGLARAGFDPASVPEVWCDLPVGVARERFERRARGDGRHPMHAWAVGDDEFWSRVEQADRPQGIGPQLRVSTMQELSPGAVVDLALRAGASQATAAG
ncbi:MAG: GNAT family N-acetyltransferase [Actinomycetota bacterium]|nr:GNAT family N-acetyltransferase [Actinomycetota bacterium]